MEFETVEYNEQRCELDSKLSKYNTMHIRFLITSGVMKGCVIQPDFFGKNVIYARNPITGRELYLSPNNVRLVKNFTETYVPENVLAYYEKAKKSQTEALDKFGGIVTVDGIVAYVDHKKSADESLRIGVVTHISKAGVVTLRDIVDNTERKLPNSKRHFAIDDDIFQRLMFIKLKAGS